MVEEQKKTKRTAKKKIDRLFMQICYILGIIITIGIGITAFIFTYYYTDQYFGNKEVVNLRVDNILLNILGTIIFLMIIYIVKNIIKKIPNKILIAVTTILIMLISTGIVFFIKFTPRADQECMIYAATEFMKGTYDWLDAGNYLHRFPYQLGFVYLVETIFRMFNSQSPLLLQCMNVICIGTIVILLYNFTNKMFKDDNTNKIFSILMLGFLPIMFFSTFVYGNIIGLMFSLIAMLCILIYRENRKIRYLILSSASIGVGIILKSNYQIFLIGMEMLFLLDFIENKDKKIFVGMILSIICVIVFPKLVYLYTENRTGKEVTDGVPMISYIQMGLKDGDGQGKMAGWYDGSVVEIYEDNQCDSKKAAQISIDILKDILKDFANHPTKMIKVLAEKIGTSWLEPNYQTIWTNKPPQNSNEMSDEIKNNKILFSFFVGTLSKAYTGYNNIYQIIIFFSAGLCLVVSFRKITVEKVSLIIMVIGGFLLHLIWETKAYYVLPYYLLLVPYAANGLQIGFEKIKKQCYNLSKRKKLQGGYEERDGNNKNTMEQI